MAKYICPLVSALWYRKIKERGCFYSAKKRSFTKCDDESAWAWVHVILNLLTTVLQSTRVPHLNCCHVSYSQHYCFLGSFGWRWRCWCGNCKRGEQTLISVHSELTARRTRKTQSNKRTSHWSGLSLRRAVQCHFEKSYLMKTTWTLLSRKVQAAD